MPSIALGPKACGFVVCTATHPQLVDWGTSHGRVTIEAAHVVLATQLVLRWGISPAAAMASAAEKADGAAVTDAMGSLSVKAEEEGKTDAAGNGLTADQTRQMSDDEFFAAYKAGKVKRREDAWTEDNWEEVSLSSSVAGRWLDSFSPVRAPAPVI